MACLVSSRHRLLPDPPCCNLPHHTVLTRFFVPLVCSYGEPYADQSILSILRICVHEYTTKPPVLRTVFPPEAHPFETCERWPVGRENTGGGAVGWACSALTSSRLKKLTPLFFATRTSRTSSNRPMVPSSDCVGREGPIGLGSRRRYSRAAGAGANDTKSPLTFRMSIRFCGCTIWS